MKIIYLLIGILFCSSSISAQITLEYCQEKARNNFPLIQQYDLIEKSEKYNLARVYKSYLPQVSLNGKFSWQSDVTEFPEEFMALLDMFNSKITFPGQDQYSVGLEVTQTVWDGGMTTTQKKVISAQSEVDRQNVEVSLYALKGQVNQLFFSILLLDEQLEQNRLFMQELERNYFIVQAYVDGGVGQQSDLDQVKVEILSAQQKELEIKTSRKSFLNMLSLFIGEKLTDQVVLEKPGSELNPENVINRPELKLFDSQLQLFDIQSKTLWSKGMPRLALFAQGAYGNPGLNMFESGFTPYFIGGAQLTWKFGGLYTYRDEKRIADNQKRQIEVQREIFLFNINQQIIQKNSEIEKLQNLLDNDKEIIKLRESIQQASEAKVENGTMSISDLMQYIHAANMARQTKSLHEIQLLQLIWQLKTETGN